MWWRRGQATGNREIPTADLRFRRNETLRVEFPINADSGSNVAASLRDRQGKALSIPVSATPRDDPDGSRWIGIQLPLAPLAAGDYAIELTGMPGGRSALAAFRIVP
jgi:hypothetical protein